MRWFLIVVFLLLSAVLNSCQNNDDSTHNNTQTIDDIDEVDNPEPKNFKILALGDSYTIGQSVCESCRFPEQLKDSLKTYANENDTFQLDIVAQTGWTTIQLLEAISQTNLESQYDLVTLLIGVNNQFSNYPFSIYETEFPELVDESLDLTNNNTEKIIVVSIPDYAYTPFGEIFDDGNISTEIDAYNAFAKSYAEDNTITFVNITDITRMGLDNPELVASDGLHPSELAYSKFVERLLPLALEKLEIGD